ncbi:PRN1 [Symbiodinium necroappetens]|uniref:PRN1 protein n=1 Tax=Symbiodinium necroappetens TaxID=1628268 RepID=A0A812P2C2_9DINO|nr:PRN1 [Symbiodinium necroappetens]
MDACTGEGDGPGVMLQKQFFKVVACVGSVGMTPPVVPAELLVKEISSLHEERRHLRRQVEAADLNGTQEAQEVSAALEGARDRFLESQLRRDRLRRLVKGLEGHTPPQPEQVEVSLQERERELELQVESLRKDTANLEQRRQTFIKELEDCRRQAAERTAELRHSEELGSEAVARCAALQLELKLLQEKIFGVETERQELWQKQRKMGEQFESAWEAATAEAKRCLVQLSAEASREAGDEQGLSQAAGEAEAKLAEMAAELQRQQERLVVREPVKEAFALSSPKLEEPGPGTSDGVWQRLLQESLRAEQAELRLLEASTDGVEARKRGLQDSLKVALSKLEDLKQQLEGERIAKAEAQKMWADAQREEQSRALRKLRSHVQALRSWNSQVRLRLLKLAKRSTSSDKPSDRARAELKGHLRWISGAAGAVASFTKRPPEKAFDLNCWHQALRGLRQALQQAAASQAMEDNVEKALEVSLWEAEKTWEEVLSLVQRGRTAAAAAEGVLDAASVEEIVRASVEAEKRAAVRAAQETLREGLGEPVEELEKELLLEEALEEAREEEDRHRELELALLVARREDAELEALCAKQAAEKSAEAVMTSRSQDFRELCRKIGQEMSRSLLLQLQNLCESAAEHPDIFQKQMEEIRELKQAHSAISAAQAQALGSADLLEAELQAAWVGTVAAIEEVQASTKELAMDRDRCRLALDALRARTDAVEEAAASLWALQGEASLSVPGGRWHDRFRSISEWYSAASDALHSCML